MNATRRGSILAVPLLVWVFFSSVGFAPEPRAAEVEFLNSPESEALKLPFSEAVRVGDLLFLSGQIGTRPGSNELVPGGMPAEARQTMDNIKSVVERYGSSMDRVVKCTVFLADIAEWSAFNEIYRTYFTGSPPARSALGAAGLALGARLEVECIAAAGTRAAKPGPGAGSKEEAKPRPE